MEKKIYSSGEIIFREGVYQKWMYSISQGAVDIYAGFDTPEEKKLVTLIPGQLFGEIGMIAMMPRTATAVAATDQVLLELVTYEDMEAYLNEHPENIRQIMHNVSRRTRELTEDLSAVQHAVNELISQKDGEDSFGKRVADKMKKLLAGLKSKDPSAAFLFARESESQRCLKNYPPVVKFHAGEIIFRAGDKAECLYEIYSGAVGIYADYQSADEKLLAKLHTEAVFGEMGILDDMPRSATAVCLEDCSVLMVKKEHFMQFFRKKPMKILYILQQMCMQLRNLSNEYMDMNKKLEDLTGQDKLDEAQALSRLHEMAPAAAK